jgi:hypothetical protein
VYYIYFLLALTLAKGTQYRKEYIPIMRSWDYLERSGSGIFKVAVPEFEPFGLVFRHFLATDPEVRVRFPALPDFLRSSGSST